MNSFQHLDRLVVQFKGLQKSRKIKEKIDGANLFDWVFSRTFHLKFKPLDEVIRMTSLELIEERK